MEPIEKINHDGYTIFKLNNMKTYTIKNLTMQFDGFDNESDDRQQVIAIITSINKHLGSVYSDHDPMIYTSGIDTSDIEIEEHEIDDYINEL